MLTQTTGWLWKCSRALNLTNIISDNVPELPWEKVGGQEAALQAIKDAIELPLLHADLFKNFSTPRRRVFCFTVHRVAGRR